MLMTPVESWAGHVGGGRRAEYGGRRKQSGVCQGAEKSGVRKRGQLGTFPLHLSSTSLCRTGQRWEGLTVSVSRTSLMGEVFAAWPPPWKALRGGFCVGALPCERWKGGGMRKTWSVSRRKVVQSVEYLEREDAAAHPAAADLRFWRRGMKMVYWTGRMEVGWRGRRQTSPLVLAFPGLLRRPTSAVTCDDPTDGTKAGTAESAAVDDAVAAVSQVVADDAAADVQRPWHPRLQESR
jgi:hypothetical protein